MCITIQIALDRQATSELSIPIMGVLFFGAIGNFSLFFEIAAAVRLDGGDRRLRLLPLMIFSFLISGSACLRALFTVVSGSFLWQPWVWVKTPHAADTRPARTDL